MSQVLWPLALLSACANGEAYSGPPPAADFEDFRENVYPVLLRDCAFPQCHGGEQRFFRVVGPGRVRLDAELDSADPATDAEVMLSFERAVSMLQTDADVDRSLILQKPLEVSAGGQGHKGLDALGRNVYSSKLDPDYAVLEDWARRAVQRRRGTP